VLALDVEEDLVQYMKQRALRENLTNVIPRLCPFDDPGLEPESVDRILIVNTWHHIKQRVAYAQKLARALRKDGALYVIDFAKQATVGPPVEARLNPSRILSELEQAQMAAELLEEDLPQQYVIRAVAR
jgi:SAM-dependent methyltransferase